MVIRKELSNAQGSPAELMSRIGRSSTPPVKASPYDISLFGLLNYEALFSSTQENILVLSRTPVSKVLEELVNCISVVPGTGIKLAQSAQVSRMIVDSEAFVSGPWIDADTYQGTALAEEVYEMSRLLRSAGKPVYFIHRNGFEGPLTARIASASDLALPVENEIESEVITVEGATQTVFWETMLKAVKEQFA